MEVTELFEKAAEWAATKVKSVTADHLSSDTPCDEWDVKALTNHMTSGVDFLARAARGEDPDPNGFTADYVGDDPATAYSAALAAAKKELKQPGLLEKTLNLPFGEMPAQVALSIFAADQITHGWDLAKATGQDATIPPELAKAALGVVGGNIGDDRRGEGKFFKAEVPVSESASDQDKLIAYLGRNPS